MLAAVAKLEADSPEPKIATPPPPITTPAPLSSPVRNLITS
jgi:hypothetical protein